MLTDCLKMWVHVCLFSVPKVLTTLHLRCGKCFVMKITYSFGYINEDYCSVTYSECCSHFIREIYLTCCNTERPPLSSHYVKLQMCIFTARQLSGEGNVFNRDYLSFCLPTVGGRGGGCPLYRVLAPWHRSHCTATPPRHVQTCWL